MLEEKLVELWPEYSCLYGVRSSDFKNRGKREVAISEISYFLQHYFTENTTGGHFVPSSEVT